MDDRFAGADLQSLLPAWWALPEANDVCSTHCFGKGAKSASVRRVLRTFASSAVTTKATKPISAFAMPTDTCIKLLPDSTKPLEMQSMISPETAADPANRKDSARAMIVADYEQLRTRLAELNSASVKDTPAIEEVISQLEKTQLAFKATFGLIGNNPLDD